MPLHGSGQRPSSFGHLAPLPLNREAALCPPVPAGGPGREVLDKIIGQARRVGQVANPGKPPEGLAALVVLALNSKTGGAWDIKNLRSPDGKKLYPDAQHFGDFLYGANSVAMGIHPRVSDLGADLYSLWDNGTL